MRAGSPKLNPRGWAATSAIIEAAVRTVRCMIMFVVRLRIPAPGIIELHEGDKNFKDMIDYIV